MENHLYKIVEKLLSKNKLSFDTEELKLQIQSHPSYPSLHAITGVLDHFGIENLALDVPQTKEVFDQLPQNFIAHIKTDTEEELVLVSKKNNTIQLFYTNGKRKKTAINDFLKLWSGIVVVTDPEHIEVSNKQNKSFFIKLFLSLFIALSLYALYAFSSLNKYNTAHFLLSLSGVFVSFLLVKHELGLHSASVDKLCTATEKTSCDAVLNSKGAKLLGKLKLSDVSFIYFTSLSLVWVVSFLSNYQNNSTIKLLAIATIPVVLYSVFYQAVIVKKWCPLCLATASILTLQALVTLQFNPFDFNLESKGFLIFASVFLFAIVVYDVLKNTIKTNINLKKEQIVAYKFKRNPSIFNALYQKGSVIGTSIPNLKGEIHFGNPNAKAEILLVTNPLCGFCKAKHQQLDKLLMSNSNDFNAIIRFNISTDDKTNTVYRISNILLNIYKSDKAICREALHQIYTNGVDVTKWLKTYNKYDSIDNYSILKTEKEWCTNNQINFTPALYLNGKEYPKEYELTDLPLFIEELQQEKQQVETV